MDILWRYLHASTKVPTKHSWNHDPLSYWSQHRAYWGLMMFILKGHQTVWSLAFILEFLDLFKNSVNMLLNLIPCHEHYRPVPHPAGPRWVLKWNSKWNTKWNNILTLINGILFIHYLIWQILTFYKLLSLYLVKFDIYSLAGIF